MLLATIPLLAALASLAAPADAPAVPDAWLTRAERSQFVETSRYEETLAYCRRLQASSPWIRTQRFGVSPEGRDLILVVASSDRAFDPVRAARTGKPIVLIQAGIHAGEVDGKDAGLMLLRDIAVTKRHAALLDHAIVLFMPIYNVDGHERFGPHNRINQNGPREMGWRTTARNLNLNRDYMKADALETRAWLRAYTSWWPDLLVDCHVTDGADYRYDVTYAYEAGPNTPEPVARWIESAVTDHVVPQLTAGGHLPSPYVFLKDDTDPSAGLVNPGPTTPRFSTGYTVLQNRPSFLLETHMLKDYRSRVLATYDTLVALLAEVNRDGETLRSAVRQADAAARVPGSVALRFRPNEAGARKVPFQGIEYRREWSDISGAVRVIYGSQPIDIEVPAPEGVEVTLAVRKPLAYLVPPQWTEVIEVLAAHGIRLRRLKGPWSAPVEGYRLTEPVWKAQPFEGRHNVKFETERIGPAARTFAAGSVLVPMDQRSSAVATHLLEPQAPDALVYWGFFDAIFEQKEYAEDYVMERIAREMLAHDPALKAAFEEALADPEFAGSPARRLDFFFRRSPWADDRVGLYPIGRIVDPAAMPSDRMLEPLVSAEPR